MTRLNTAALAALEFIERSDPDLELAKWLTDRGVDVGRALSIIGPLAEHRVSVMPRGQFDFAGPLDDEATWAVVHLAFGDNAETPVDLIAWTRDRPDRMLRCLGAADALGIDQLCNPASYFGQRALWVRKNALEWLAAGCDGIVPFNFAPLRDRLQRLPKGQSCRLATDSVTSGRALRRELQPLPMNVRIMVPAPTSGVAA
jgi:hypothetical protein